MALIAIEVIERAVAAFEVVGYVIAKCAMTRISKVYLRE